MHRHLIAAAVVALSAPTYADEYQADPAGPGQLFRDGSAKLDLRLRYEHADTEGTAGPDDSEALTLRSRLTLSSGAWTGFHGQFEVDDVSGLGDMHYNDATNGRPGPAIADAPGTEINQAWIGWHNEDLWLRWGRQRINLDNQRFVGGVGFRQNEQTYDGISLRYEGLAETTLQLAHVDNVNRIFGPKDPKGDHEGSSYLVHAQYRGLERGTLSLYGYLLDNQDAPAFSTDTWGLRYASKPVCSDYGKISYTLEYATQTDSDDNPAHYRADYYLAELGLERERIATSLGYEVLEAEDNGMFITPLATLHKFQGWADMFLGAGGSGNIAAGIRDAYAKVSTQSRGVKFTAIYHDFRAENETAALDELGTEWDFSAQRSLHERLNLTLAYARYDAKDFATDSQRFWATLDFQY